MPFLPINLNPLSVEGHAFVPHRPNSGLTLHGPDFRTNPAIDVSGAWGATLVVGLTSRDESETFTLQDVVDIVREVRTEQVGDPSASFLTQRGIYKHKDGKRVVEEDGVRIIIINLTEKPPVFRKQMIALAESIAASLNQEVVILEIQHKGMTKNTFLVTV